MSDIKKLLQKIDTIGTPIMEDAALPKKFPGYLKGTASAKDVEKKMIGMEEGSAATLAGQTLAKKAASKIIPGVGTALSYKDAWDRWQKGDKVGAAMAGAAGTAFLVPGPGAVVGTALDAANIGRDIKAGEYDDLFKEENVLKKKNKKHDVEIDEGLVGDALRYGAKGARWVKNLFKGNKGITPVTPIPNRTASGGKPAGGATQSPGTAGGATKSGSTDNVVDIKAKDVTDRQVPAVRPATPVAVRSTPVAVPRSTVPFKKPAPVPPWKSVATGAAVLGGGLGAGYIAGGSPSTSSSTSSDKITSTPVASREPVATVNTSADPERSFVAPPAGSEPGSRFRAPTGASISTRDFNIGGSELGSDFETRTTPSPQAPQGFQFSKEQEEWLTRRGGNPNRQDPYILSRMLKKAGGPTPPLSYFTNPEDREIAKRLGFPEVPLEESYSKSVNRLIRKFENYLDNRFDIVENNYIPKKKNLG